MRLFANEYMSKCGVELKVARELEGVVRMAVGEGNERRNRRKGRKRRILLVLLEAES